MASDEVLVLLGATWVLICILLITNFELLLETFGTPRTLCRKNAAVSGDTMAIGYDSGRVTFNFDLDGIPHGRCYRKFQSYDDGSDIKTETSQSTVALSDSGSLPPSLPPRLLSP